MERWKTWKDGKLENMETWKTWKDGKRGKLISIKSWKAWKDGKYGKLEILESMESWKAWKAGKHGKMENMESWKASRSQEIIFVCLTFCCDSINPAVSNSGVNLLRKNHDIKKLKLIVIHFWLDLGIGSGVLVIRRRDDD
jgi:hypothetical protein